MLQLKLLSLDSLRVGRTRGARLWASSLRSFGLEEYSPP